MQLDRKTLAFGQLPNSKGDLYEPATGRKGYVHNITLHNTGASAEDVVLNFHDGTDENEILSESIAAYDTYLLDFPGEGETVDEGAKITGNTDTASTVTYKFSGTEEIPDAVGASAAGVSSNLWAPPAAAHAQDAEFEADTLTGWTVQNLGAPAVGSVSANTVDPYDTTFTSGNALRVNAHSNGRRSWILCQPPASSAEFALFKAYTLPTNLLVYARLRFGQLRTGWSDDDSSIGVGFMTAATGVPTTASRVMTYLNNADAGIMSARGVYWSTGGSPTGLRSTDIDAQGQALQYVAVHKVGTTFHHWVGTSESNWIWLNSHSSVGFTPDLVGFCFENVSSADIVAVSAVDFIRFIETDKFLL